MRTQREARGEAGELTLWQPLSLAVASLGRGASTLAVEQGSLEGDGRLVGAGRHQWAAHRLLGDDGAAAF